MTRSVLHLIIAYAVLITLVGGYLLWLARRERLLKDALHQLPPAPPEFDPAEQPRPGEL